MTCEYTCCSGKQWVGQLVDIKQHQHRDSDRANRRTGDTIRDNTSTAPKKHWSQTCRVPNGTPKLAWRQFAPVKASKLICNILMKTLTQQIPSTNGRIYDGG